MRNWKEVSWQGADLSLMAREAAEMRCFLEEANLPANWRLVAEVHQYVIDAVHGLQVITKLEDNYLILNSIFHSLGCVQDYKIFKNDFQSIISICALLKVFRNAAQCTLSLYYVFYITEEYFGRRWPC